MVGCAWAAEGLGLLPMPAAVAAGASAASAVTWRAYLRSRGAFARTESQRAEAEEGLKEAQAGRARAEQALWEISGLIEMGWQQIVWAVSEVEQGRVRVHHAPPPPLQQTGDLYDDVLAALTHGQTVAWQAVIAAAAHQHHLLNQDAELAEIFRPISARLHSLIYRTLAVLDEVEREVEDPDLLGELFRIDNLVTRMRRGAESLAVLGGDLPSRTVEPVLVATVLRMAIGEIEDYPRVQIVHSDQPVALPGYVSPSIVHLLAELVENATRFSATDVEVRTSHVTDGLAIEIVDRGPGMTAQKRAALNDLLARPEGADPRSRLREGQIGLLVAALLAKRHGVVIKLHPDAMGGIRAVVVLPGRLLVTPVEQLAPSHAAAPSHTPAAVPAQGVPMVSAGPERPVVGLPRRLPQTLCTTDGDDDDGHSRGRPDQDDGGVRPALPRREAAQAGHVPAPAPDVPRETVGPPSPDLMARFIRTRPAGD
ncbi:ATP-binding protein [Streptomyces sp. NBC_00825]|uniref:sensor histidine kinase n=1 Tax=unclassified Streptomyces TaxID=2593676 RepID=UPI002ED42F1B|nr:ATP-binding protein [Streptomyces sp. NBC_00826]WTH89024.1 ATP-binding protein [Streptomyces sp. NBC_00825]WTH97754.1 ATP-binding protein [Streptomyces sp. NBC_00822]